MLRIDRCVTAAMSPDSETYAPELGVDKSVAGSSQNAFVLTS